MQHMLKQCHFCHTFHIVSNWNLCISHGSCTVKTCLISEGLACLLTDKLCYISVWLYCLELMRVLQFGHVSTEKSLCKNCCWQTLLWQHDICCHSLSCSSWWHLCWQLWNDKQWTVTVDWDLTSKWLYISGQLWQQTVRCASKKAGGTSKNKRKHTKGQRRGWKKNDGDFVEKGMILYRQLGLRFYPGENVRDCTCFQALFTSWITEL